MLFGLTDNSDFNKFFNECLFSAEVPDTQIIDGLYQTNGSLVNLLYSQEQTGEIGSIISKYKNSVITQDVLLAFQDLITNILSTAVERKMLEYYDNVNVIQLQNKIQISFSAKEVKKVNSDYKYIF